MQTLIAFLLPALLFFRIGRKGLACLNLLLQLTLIGWPIATLWALYMLYRPATAARHDAPSSAKPSSKAPDAAKPAGGKPKSTAGAKKK